MPVPSAISPAESCCLIRYLKTSAPETESTRAANKITAEELMLLLPV